MSSARFRPRSDRLKPRKGFTSKGADKEHTGGSRRAFEEEFQQITSYITHFEGCISESQKLFDKLKETSEGAGTQGKECRGSSFMTEVEERQLKVNLSKKSTILVVGQSNSGKTCLVNELLGGSFLPTDEVPCTSRIVRLKYSEQNYLKVLNKDGSVSKTITSFTKKSIPKSEIALEANRSNAEWVEQVVEIGIKNSFLQSGHLEIVDAPGTSENKALDKVVEECLNGILQVIIYVVDGNSSLRMQEQEFLFSLKAKMGHLPIFYVCNKVDRNKKAGAYDRDSDDEDSIIQTKTQLSYTKLVNKGLLPDDVKLEECHVYHAVSTKEVRKARKDKKSNQYTEEFEKMKTKLLKFVKESIHSYLETATAQLCLAQRRVFDFVLSGDLMRRDSSRVDTIIGKLKSLEMKHYLEADEQMRDSESKLSATIKKEIETDHLKRILRMAQSTKTAQMLTGDVLDDTRVIVWVLVTCNAVKKGKELLENKTSSLRTSLEKSFREVEKTDSNDLDSILRKHLLECIQLNYRISTSDLPEEFNQVLLKRGVDFLTPSEDIKNAEDVIRLIDYGEVARCVLHVVSGKLKQGHSSFTAQIQAVENSSKDQASQRQSRAHQVVAVSPEFAEQICKAEALRNFLSSGSVQLGSEIKRGHRGVVYECRDPAMGGMVAKHLTSEGRAAKASGEYLALQYAMRRIPEDCESILKPVSLCLDCKHNVTILFPKMELNLYEALTVDRDEGMRLGTSLRIVLHVTNACLYSRQLGLSHVDPRITNVLLDTHGAAKLNVAKQRDDKVPYPDEMAPFHVPQPQPAQLAQVESYVGHDLYSIAVLLWLLLNGEYRRPLYAGTTDVKKVYSAVLRGEGPDVSHCLSEMEHYNNLFALFQLSFFVWKKEKSEMLDLLNFKEKLSELCDLVDSQVVQGTTKVS